jgi:hypothetical protein
VQVILIRDASAAGHDLALVTTDTDASPAAPIERYAARWSIEVAIEDARQIFGAGQARNRAARAVERTVPFQLACQTIAAVWYATAGHTPPTSRIAAPVPPGTPPRPSRRPRTCSPSSAVFSSPPDFGHLALASRHPKKSTPSAWPEKPQRHNRESRVTGRNVQNGPVHKGRAFRVAELMAGRDLNLRPPGYHSYDTRLSCLRDA